MQSFVAQTIDMYRGGFDSRRMLLQARPAAVATLAWVAR